MQDCSAGVLQDCRAVGPGHRVALLECVRPIRIAGQGDRQRALTLRRMRERARKELGQHAKVTLDALRALDEEAEAIGRNRFYKLGTPTVGVALESLAATIGGKADGIAQRVARSIKGPRS